jgi:peptide/nickel transport system ATP-binding protein
MNSGQNVETGTVEQILQAPSHPYTKKLLNSIPGRRGLNTVGNISEGHDVILEVRELKKYYLSPTTLFKRRNDSVERALDGVSFELRQGETLGIVGESGSGKSTLARTLLGLESTTSGSVHFCGANITTMSSAEFQRVRRHIQMVFQDPSSSLNPRMSVEQIICEPWAIHPDVMPSRQWRSRVGELLEQVGLDASDAKRSPHQFSGGQRQRIAIARALALKPKIIICDEAVSSLDVSIQAQVIALLKKLKADYGLSYLFIAHNLSVVGDFADRVMVMYKGSIVEQGETAEVFGNPKNQYTRDLLAAEPIINVKNAAAR